MKLFQAEGGIRDAVSLATELSAVEGVRVIYSLAGVTREPIVPTCEVRTGGFGGVEGLQRYLEDARIDAVLDATPASKASPLVGTAYVAPSRFVHARFSWVSRQPPRPRFGELSVLSCSPERMVRPAPFPFVPS